MKFCNKFPHFCVIFLSNFVTKYFPCHVLGGEKHGVLRSGVDTLEEEGDY